jgi:hypothetical protein
MESKGPTQGCASVIHSNTMNGVMEYIDKVFCRESVILEDVLSLTGLLATLNGTVFWKDSAGHDLTTSSV